MFILTLHDRLGNELSLGDLVKISDGKRFKFYTRIAYNQERKSISPFDTFSFHSVEKVDAIPDHAHKCDGEYWFVSDEIDESPEQGKDYLMSWRKCEHNLRRSMFRIKPLPLTNPEI